MCICAHFSWSYTLAFKNINWFHIRVLAPTSHKSLLARPIFTKNSRLHHVKTYFCYNFCGKLVHIPRPGLKSRYFPKSLHFFCSMCWETHFKSLQNKLIWTWTLASHGNAARPLIKCCTEYFRRSKVKDTIIMYLQQKWS